MIKPDKIAVTRNNATGEYRINLDWNDTGTRKQFVGPNEYEVVRKLVEWFFRALASKEFEYDPPESFREMYDILAYAAYGGKPKRPEVNGNSNGGGQIGPKGLVVNQRAADFLEDVDASLYRIKYRILDRLTPRDEEPNLHNLEEILQARDQRKQKALDKD